MDAGEAGDPPDQTRTAAASGPGARRARPTSAAATRRGRPGPSSPPTPLPIRPAWNVAALLDGTPWQGMRRPGGWLSGRLWPRQPGPGQHVLRHRPQMHGRRQPRQRPHGTPRWQSW